MAALDTYKVTLGTGKVVHLREPKIKYNELAAKSAASKLGKNPSNVLTGMIVSKELLKLMIAAVNDERLSHEELEDFDNLFTYKEYIQLQKVLMELTGGDEEDSDNGVGKYRIEIGSSGGRLPGSAAIPASDHKTF